MIRAIKMDGRPEIVLEDLCKRIAVLTCNNDSILTTDGVYVLWDPVGRPLYDPRHSTER